MDIGVTVALVIAAATLAFIVSVIVVSVRIGKRQQAARTAEPDRVSVQAGSGQYYVRYNITWLGYVPGYREYSWIESNSEQIQLGQFPLHTAVGRLRFVSPRWLPPGKLPAVIDLQCKIGSDWHAVRRVAVSESQAYGLYHALVNQPIPDLVLDVTPEGVVRMRPDLHEIVGDVLRERDA